jgi:Tfp pilus assembly protein PilP
MKNIFIILIFLGFLGAPSINFAQGYSVFPQESLHDVMLIACDGKTSSFVMQNRKGEQVTGYIGDLIGYEEEEVVQVTDKHITVQRIEIIVNKNGKQHEQQSRMRIPVSFGLDGHGKGTR